MLNDWSFQRIHLLFVFLRESSTKTHYLLWFLYFLLGLLDFLCWFLNHSILFLLKWLVIRFLLFFFIRFLFNNLQFRRLHKMLEPRIFVLLRNVFFELVRLLMERVNTCGKCFWEFRRVQILFGVITIQGTLSLLSFGRIWSSRFHNYIVYNLEFSFWFVPIFH